MAKELKISMQTGRIDVPDVPDAGQSDEVKNERTLAVVAEINAELAELQTLVESEPRKALLQAWVLRAHLDAHPVRWIRNYAQRKDWNDAAKALDGVKEQASAALPADQGKTLWEDLPYVRESLPLLFTKMRAQGEVQRLILTPLGKLQFSKIRYQREGPDDLIRVAREIEEVVGKSADIDEQVKRWGDVNLPPLLRGEPPVSLPADLPTPGLGAGLAALGALLLLAGAAFASGQVMSGGLVLGLVLLLCGLAFAGLGGAKLSAALRARAAAPAQFTDLGARVRERLYLICSLRGLYQMTSGLTRATDALDRYHKDHGGPARWKRVKIDERDLTQLFAEDPDSWHPKETIESWLADKVTKAYRLDSQSLTAQEDIDPDAWDAIARAYQLASDDASAATEGKLLDVVADLIFIKRGEDMEAERKRVFALVHEAWQKAERERATR